jgi:hypothetical protein
MAEQPASSLTLRAAPQEPGRAETDDYDVLSEGRAVGRIFRPDAGTPRDLPWAWSIFLLERKPGTTGNGCAATLKQAMATVAARWPEVKRDGK